MFYRKFQVVRQEFVGGSPFFYPSKCLEESSSVKALFWGETWQDPQVELKISEEFGLISRLVYFLLGVG